MTHLRVRIQEMLWRECKKCSLLRRKTCVLLNAKTSALFRRKTCAVLRARHVLCSKPIQRWGRSGAPTKGGRRPSAATFCGFCCIGSEQSKRSSPRRITFLASQQGKCPGFRQGACLPSQQNGPNIGPIRSQHGTKVGDFEIT